MSILHIMGLLAINPKGLCCQITSHTYTRNSGDATNTDALAAVAFFYQIREGIYFEELQWFFLHSMRGVCTQLFMTKGSSALQAPLCQTDREVYFGSKSCAVSHKNKSRREGTPKS